MMQKVDYETGEIITADDAWERHNRILEYKNAIAENALRLGEELYWLEEKKQYKDLGHKTFEEYLGSAEVAIKRSTAFQFKGIYEKFVLRLKVHAHGLLEAGTYKLDLLTRYVNKEKINDDNAEYWVNEASVLSYSDLQKNLDDAFPPETAPPLPQGKYNIIYADPPWDYDNSGFDDSAASHYPTMTVDEIRELSVQELAGNPCVLFLWATSPLLPEALQVMEAWGFKYKAGRVWIKNRGPRIGWWVNTRHEHLLIGVHGDNWHPQELLDSIIEAPVTRHSKKPEQIYTDIELVYPNSKRIELFARQTKDGWEAWGNEV